jgi:hypothetical protein
MTVENSQNKDAKGEISTVERQNMPVGLESQGRRSAVRKLAVGSVAVAGLSVLPGKWVTPLVEFGTLPAHAVTTGSLEAVLEELKNELAPEKEEKPAETNDESTSGTNDSRYSKKETIKKTGDIMIDRILRSKFVSNRRGPTYGKTINIVFNTGEQLFVPDTSRNVDTKQGRAYRPGGNYHLNKDVHNMEVYADPGSRATSITIYYNG